MLPWKSVPTLGLAAQGRVAAKRFIKPIPYDELLSEIDIFCELFSWPALMDLRKFVESRGGLPYLPADPFFADFEKSCRAEPSRRKHYRSYNDALMLLDNESWSTLKQKAIEQFPTEREGQ